MAALSKIIRMSKSLTLLWEQMSVAEIEGAIGSCNAKVEV